MTTRIITDNVSNGAITAEKIDANVLSALGPTIADEGAVIVTGVSNINFKGTAVTVTNTTGTKVDVAINSTITVANQGSVVTTAASNLNFAGGVFNVTDSAGNTTVTFTGPISISNGGTGAQTANVALANLGGISASKAIALAIVFR